MTYNLDDIDYRRGYRAYCKGFGVEHCPYAKDSTAWHLWMSGHSAAEFNSER